MKTKIGTVALSLLLATVSLVSCAKKAEDHGTLYVAYPTGNIRIAINIIAQQKKFFEQEGVTVKEINIMGNPALTALNEQSESLDILTVGFVPDLSALVQGYDLTFIGGTAVEGGALIAKQGRGNIYTNSQNIIDFEAVRNALVSGKAGFVRNEASWVVTRQYLLDNKVFTENEIENIEKNNIKYYAEPLNTAQAVATGEIDIGFLPMEYSLLYGESLGLDLITSSGALLPNYVCCREVTTPQKLNAKKDSFIAYERARLRALEYYSNPANKDEVVDIVAKWSGKERDYVETYLYGGVTKYQNDPNTNGIIKYYEAAYNSGLFSSLNIDLSNFDVASYVDTSAYKAALDSLVKQNPSNSFYKDYLALYNASN